MFVEFFYRKDGAGDRIRTGDINLGKVALYQLSYSRSGTTSFSREGPSIVNLMQLSCLNHNLSRLFPFLVSYCKQDKYNGKKY